MSNLLGVCPLGRKNCLYDDAYCSDCIKYEKGKRASTSPIKKGRELGKGFGKILKEELKMDQSEVKKND